MGRIRTIKPEFFLHDGLFDLEDETGLPVRLAFAGLWCQADREGRFRWRPRTLKPAVLPHDSVDFSRVLDALASRGFVVKYTCNGKDYGWIPGFAEHQSINNREQDSVLPAPPAMSEPRSSGDTDGDVTRDARVQDASQPPLEHAQGEGKGRERKGKEGNGKEKGRSRRRAEDVPVPTELDTPEFRQAWTEWLAYRRERRLTLTGATLQRQLTKLARAGPDAAITAIEASITNGWQGLFEPHDKDQSRGKPNQSRHAPGPGQQHPDDRAADLF